MFSPYAWTMISFIVAGMFAHYTQSFACYALALFAAAVEAFVRHQPPTGTSPLVIWKSVVIIVAPAVLIVWLLNYIRNIESNLKDLNLGLLTAATGGYVVFVREALKMSKPAMNLLPFGLALYIGFAMGIFVCVGSSSVACLPLQWQPMFANQLWIRVIPADAPATVSCDETVNATTAYCKVPATQAEPKHTTLSSLKTWVFNNQKEHFPNLLDSSMLKVFKPAGDGKTWVEEKDDGDEPKALVPTSKRVPYHIQAPK